MCLWLALKIWERGDHDDEQTENTSRLSWLCSALAGGASVSGTRISMESIVHPHTSYLIFATPRSGSYLLCEALINTRLAGFPTEYFGPEQTGRIWKRLNTSNYAECLVWIVKEGTTPNGVFGGKVIWQFHETLVDCLRDSAGYEKLPVPELLSTAFPNLYYIWATRRDKVRQAISYWKAMQTRAWVDLGIKDWQLNAPMITDHQASQFVPPSQSTIREVTFDYKAIERLRRGLEQDEVEIQQYFAACGIEPFKVVYEDFVNTYEQTALQLLDYLHIPAPPHLVFGERKLKKQADEQSEEWLQRYYQLKQQYQQSLLIS
jgi:trehalose 2-sulfotransferase